MQLEVFFKKQADLAVLQRKAKIQCAKDFYDFCFDTLRTPKSGIYKRRIFKYVEVIPRNNCINYRPITENRKIHQIIAHDSCPGELITNHLSCYDCEHCLIRNSCSQICKNKKFIGQSKVLKMKEISSRNLDQSDTDLEEVALRENISNLVEIGSVIAVLADDPDYEYYIMKVNQKSRVLERERCDVWGGRFPAGAAVVEGFFYDRSTNNTLLYKLIPNKPAIVYTMSVRYICIEITPNKTVTIPEQLHLDIIKSLDN